MSLVSVVMPVRNAAPFLSEALASITSQTYADLEVIVQDDGSTDHSVSIVEAAARADVRIRLEVGPPRGVAHAANRAAERARGDLLVRMDADDVALPERVACLVDYAAAHPDVDMLASRVRYFPRAAVGPGMARYETWLNELLTHEQIFTARFVEYPLPHPTTAIRRAAWQRLGGYRQGDFPEDYELFLRAASMGLRFGKHPDVLLAWREGAHRSTKSDPRYGLERFHALKAEHLVPHLRTLGRPVVILSAGRGGKRWARSLLAAGVVPQAFLDAHPGRVGARIVGIPVLARDAYAAVADAFFLAAGGVRATVRAQLAAGGLEEERDYLCVQ
ncbi:MAG: glycosyltransferase [Planctomycetota bacterium]|nr:glycosyltransferase [Planctomycetota bacterium]